MVNEKCVTSVIKALTQTESDAWCKRALRVPIFHTLRHQICLKSKGERGSTAMLFRINRVIHDPGYDFEEQRTGLDLIFKRALVGQITCLWSEFLSQEYHTEGNTSEYDQQSNVALLQRYLDPDHLSFQTGHLDKTPNCSHIICCWTRAWNHLISSVHTHLHAVWLDTSVEPSVETRWLVWLGIRPEAADNQTSNRCLTRTCRCEETTWGDSYPTFYYSDIKQ